MSVSIPHNARSTLILCLLQILKSPLYKRYTLSTHAALFSSIYVTRLLEHRKSCLHHEQTAVVIPHNNNLWLSLSHRKYAQYRRHPCHLITNAEASFIFIPPLLAPPLATPQESFVDAKTTKLQQWERLLLVWALHSRGTLTFVSSKALELTELDDRLVIRP